jgi:hypothetical protein
MSLSTAVPGFAGKRPLVLLRSEPFELAHQHGARSVWAQGRLEQELF